MKITISQNQFINEFNDIRPDNFSYEALELLYDWFEELDPEMELDVIAICCEFSEYSVDEAIEYFDIDISGCTDADEIKEAIADYFQDNTMVVGMTDKDTFVIQDF